MQIYHYSRDTGEYLRESTARPSPLEPDVFLIPANSTEYPPPVVGANQVAVFAAGLWTTQPDFRGAWFDGRTPVTVNDIGPLPESYTAEPLPFTADELLAVEKNRIAAERFTLETSGVDYLGMTILTDRESAQILDSAIEKIRRGLIPAINWKCADGWLELNPSNIDAIEVLVLTHVQTAFAWEKSQVDALEA